MSKHRNSYTWDENRVRLNFVKSIQNRDINWLFIPGGPGMDSSYMFELAASLSMVGTYWLVDMPGNGGNIQENEMYDFDKWKEYLLFLIQKFVNPIIVAHSFGAMLTFSVPELEDLLRGFVVINSAPTGWSNAREQIQKDYSLPVIENEFKAYMQNSTQENFRMLQEKAVLHLFNKKSIEQGLALLRCLPYNHHAYRWWIQKAFRNYNVSWIPKNNPVLILCGEKDFITPSSLFVDDVRFHSSNIQIEIINDASHFCWFDNMQITCELIENYARRYIYTFH